MDFRKLLESEVRRDWLEWGCRQAFDRIKSRLEEELRDPSRIGALELDEIAGVEGLQCFMAPLEGYRKLLQPKSVIRLLNIEGAALFEGMFESSFEKIRIHEEFFIWMKPTRLVKNVEPSNVHKVMGAMKLKRTKN